MAQEPAVGKGTNTSKDPEKPAKDSEKGKGLNFEGLKTELQNVMSGVQGRIYNRIFHSNLFHLLWLRFSKRQL